MRWLSRGYLPDLLRAGYLAVIAVTLALTGLMHVFAPPKLDYIRVPLYMGEAGALFGWSQDGAFRIYHGILVGLSLIAFINYSGLSYGHLPRVRTIARVSSFVGIFAFTGVLIVFAAGLVSDAMAGVAPTAWRSSAILAPYAFVLVVLDVLSFAVFFSEWLAERRHLADGLPD